MLSIAPTGIEIPKARLQKQRFGFSQSHLLVLKFQIKNILNFNLPSLNRTYWY